MGDPISGVPPKAQPWARAVDNDLKTLKRKLNILGTNLLTIPDLDRTVFYEFSTGQNIVNGTNGRVEPTSPVNVRFVSSTGLFEVTVSLAGLVKDGATLGASFESTEQPYEIYFGLPTYGVSFTAPVGQTTWAPFAASYSTVLSTRPGVQNLALYLHGICNTGVDSAAFVKRARLSVKAV